MKAKEERARIQVNEHEDSLKKQREIAADIAKKIGLGSSAVLTHKMIKFLRSTSCNFCFHFLFHRLLISKTYLTTRTTSM